ncbi:hypothetical protein PsorP6_004956 [Peronosclerospora sorghi]|uniref:Uncharacterized protein n=1 Tax=Peronosclerospora sorghi TaxID=230839 RepID=A0ACC0W3F8_9STRA|nr:hypothetical protein PsorP6_004956 [Peronosclerospora sorghi]
MLHKAQPGLSVIFLRQETELIFSTRRRVGRTTLDIGIYPKRMDTLQNISQIQRATIRESVLAVVSKPADT